MLCFCLSFRWAAEESPYLCSPETFSTHWPGAKLSSGTTVCSVGSVDEALAVFSRVRPDVLVTDLGMPEKDGYALLKAVREFTGSSRDVPAIAVTAYARAEDEARVRMAGFKAHVAKPVEPAYLVEVIGAAVGRRADA